MIRFARLSLVAPLSLCTVGVAAVPAAAQEATPPVHADAERPKTLVPLYISSLRWRLSTRIRVGVH